MEMEMFECEADGLKRTRSFLVRVCHNHHQPYMYTTMTWAKVKIEYLPDILRWDCQRDDFVEWRELQHDLGRPCMVGLHDSSTGGGLIGEVGGHCGQCGFRDGP